MALSLCGPTGLWDGVRFFSSRQFAKLRDGLGMASGSRQGWVKGNTDLIHFILLTPNFIFFLIGVNWVLMD